MLEYGLGWIIGGTCRKLARYFAIDSAIGWINGGRIGLCVTQRNDADVILATGPPFAAFVLAKRLAEDWDVLTYWTIAIHG